jgi:hydrogenase-4 component E
MLNAANAALMAVLVLNLFALGTSRIVALIRIVAVQGALLGILPLLLHGRPDLVSTLAAAAAIVLKGIAIPAIMARALRDARIKREIEPLIGFLPSILLGAAATALSLLLAGKAMGPESGTLVIPSSFATVLVGFILLVTRFKAITQVVGYLVLENGIFIFGLLLIEAVPLVVEMGMLLDLFVGVFVISIIVNHINSAFSSLDTRALASLKEE